MNEINEINEIQKLKIIKQIKQRYNIDEDIDIPFNFEYSDINPNYIDGNGEEFNDEPIYWFIIDNKKYVMKEQLDICIKFDPDTKNDPKKYKDKLYNFFRNDINKFSFIPKLLDETPDFFIFEYIQGEVLIKLTEDIQNKILKYTYEFKDIYKDWIFSKRFSYFWVKNKKKIYYVNIRHFEQFFNNELIIISPEGKEVLKEIVFNRKDVIDDIFRV